MFCLFSIRNKVNTYISEITCPPSPNIHNGIANTSLALYGTFVGYNCSYGYEFPDHSTNKTIQCTDHGNWSATVEDCRGKYSFKNNYTDDILGINSIFR